MSCPGNVKTLKEAGKDWYNSFCFCFTHIPQARLAAKNGGVSKHSDTNDNGDDDDDNDDDDAQSRSPTLADVCLCMLTYYADVC